MPASAEFGWSFVSRVAAIARLGTLAALTAGVVGCGSSSSSSSGPFVGRWELDSAATSTSSVMCPTGSAANFPLWSELDFESGVLTDITEASPACTPGLSLRASGGTLNIANPDPYTGEAPVCFFSIGFDANNNQVFLKLTVDSLTFNLLAPAAGKAPTASLKIAGHGDLQGYDSTGNFGTLDTCTYGSDTPDVFHRMTKG